MRRTKTTSRFELSIHDDVSADIADRVVRLELIYGRRGTMVNLTLEAAIKLRNLLDGLFDAAGIDDSGDSQ